MKTILSITILLIGISFRNEAAIYYVDPRADYSPSRISSIVEGHSRASDGDVLVVQSGIYEEVDTNQPLRLTKRITLQTLTGSVIVTNRPGSVVDPRPWKLDADTGLDLIAGTRGALQLFGKAIRNGQPIPPEISGLSFLWTRTSGPGDVIFYPNATVHNPTVRFSHRGTNSLKLIVSYRGKSATDAVTVRVTNEVQVTNFVDAGRDQIITFPINQEKRYTELNGNVSYRGVHNPTSGIAYKWEYLSPEIGGSPFIEEPNRLKTRVLLSTLAEYRFRLTAQASDWKGSDTNIVTIRPTPCIGVSVAARIDPSFPMPLLLELPPSNTVFATFSSEVVGITNPTIRWTQKSGPNAGAQIESPNSARTSISFSKPGDYVLKVAAENPAGSCNTTATVAVKVIYNAGWFVRLNEPPPPNNCDGLGIWFVNTHPKATIEVTYQTYGNNYTPPPGKFILGPNQGNVACSSRVADRPILVSARYLNLQDADTQTSRIQFASTSDSPTADGSMDFLVQGAPEQYSRVEASEDLINWRTVDIIRNTVQPTWSYDPDAGKYPARFYRVSPRD